MATLHENCEKRRKYAWAKYYEAMNRELHHAHVVVNMVQPYLNQPLRQQEQRPTEMPSHITEEFYEMARSLNKNFECPICMEMPTNKDDMVITFCGHIYTKECYDTLKVQHSPKCALCRKPL
jgi:hypothetical protein